MLELKDYELEGLSGEPMITSVALKAPPSGGGVGTRSRALVISSGLHGVEGFYGTAVQLQLLQHYRLNGAPDCKVVLLHALNPYGYSHLRRVDHRNRDLNRNFLLDDQRFQGAAKLYAQLDGFLNPKCPPSRWEPFELKALRQVMRYGSGPIQAAVAEGQYDFPRGLFFGGNEPSELSIWLRARLPDWIGDSKRVVHLDLHSGLGKWGAYKLMVETGLRPTGKKRLEQFFSERELITLAPQSTAEETGPPSRDAAHPPYRVRGSFGRWCEQVAGIDDYTFAVLEFGTYQPVRVLKALRAENQWHHWAKADRNVARERNKRASSKWVKKSLLEAFCPKSEEWRRACLQQAAGVIKRATAMLLEEGSS